MSKKEVIKRYILFITGLFFTALGVAIAKKAALGVSPISSVSDVLSLKFTSVSIGTWLTVFNCVLILGQILILRKEFKPFQLLQIPLSFIFGYFTDLGMWIVSFIPIGGYISRLGYVLAGVVVLGFGVTLTVIADVILNSGEAFVKVVADKLGKVFGNVKIAFDITCVILSVGLSLLFFFPEIKGAREGTIIAAFGTGTVVKLFTKLLKKPLDKILKG